MSNFFPKDYEMPVPEGSYWMSLKEPGTYKVRVLSHMVPGWEWWTHEGDKHQVHRVESIDDVPEEFLKTTDSRKKAKEFWAFTVYNYEEEKIQILTITQKTIMRGILTVMEDADFGELKFDFGDKKINDIQAYDLKITKANNNGRITYSVAPTPPKEIGDDIKEALEDFDVEPEKAYTEEVAVSADAENVPA